MFGDIAVLQKFGFNVAVRVNSRRSSVSLDNTTQVIHNSCKASGKAEPIRPQFGIIIAL